MFKAIIIKAKKFAWIGFLLLLVGTFLLGRLTTSDDTDNDDDKPGATSADVEDEDDSNIWTCPMHPQIQEVEPGSCPICHMELVPADDVDGDAGDHDQTAAVELSEQARDLARVRHETVERGSLTDNIDLFGTVEVSEDNEVDLTAYTGGRIERLMVSARGERVERGDLLAQIYSPDLLEAQRSLIQAQNSVQSAREAGSDRRLRAAESAMASARDRLRLLGLDHRQIDEIEQSGEASETVDIYATASGTVQTRHVSEGDYVDEGDQILSLAGLDTVWAQLDVFERDLTRIDEGKPVQVRVPALDGEEIEGRIDFVSPEIDAQRRVARARVALPNEDGRLRPGMVLDATVETPVADDEVLSVPRSAVLWTGQRSLVYEYDDELDPAGYVPREVELGPRVDDRYVIEQGLDEGAEFASSGAYRIDASLQIQDGPAMMSAERDGDGGSDAIDETIHDPPEQLDAAVRDALGAYDEIRALLAADDTDGLHDQATALQNAAEHAGDETENDGLAHHLQQLAEDAGRFHDHSEDIDIEEVRLQFGEVSREMVAVISTFPALHDELFVYECPMAEDYGKWIQLEEQMANPYMGEEMLKCGSEADWMGV